LQKTWSYMSTFFLSFGDKMVIVNFQHGECYGEMMGTLIDTL